ncbi:hypothetical protein MVEN_01833600 [Mycena venus]|uniref:Ricin B lectin domain-containing protein n=1 Tax=Mycena venus TaxID=2733690 RepID=A0A8H7CLT5_9AGAR|nr:hypothetical protein MVEN_01833600 [Mycena venus]
MAEPIYENGPEGESPIFKGFTPLPPGTYTIWSQKYQGIVVDIAGAQPNGIIQGFSSNNTIAQKWTLTAQGEGEGEYVTWEAVPLKAYIYNRDNIWGGAIVGNFPVGSTWQVNMLSPTTATIGVKGSNLLWTLTSGSPGTPIVLQNANGDPNQVWTFTQAK